MKLKTFTAQTIPEAMDAIRAELGDEALIVSSIRLPAGGVQLVVATEEQGTDTALEEALYGAPEEHHTAPLRALLNAHHTPALLVERMALSVLDSKRKTGEHLLEEALSIFTFSPLTSSKTKRAFALTGPAGVGKTIAVAKMAVEATLKKLRVSVITMDTQKAGGIEQLGAFTDVLKIPLKMARNMSEAGALIETERLKSDLILIDTPAANPWIVTDMGKVAELKQIEGVETILTLPAGLDSPESGEIADSFSRAGCSRLIATRLDASRSYGNLLYAAHMGELELANFSGAPSVTEPLYPLAPKTLAALIANHHAKGDLHK